MARESASARAHRERREARAIATEAGYTDPYPAPGTAPVVTIEDRCTACSWSMYVSLMGEVWCPNPKCSEHSVVYAPVEEVPDEQPVPAAQP